MQVDGECVLICFLPFQVPCGKLDNGFSMAGNVLFIIRLVFGHNVVMETNLDFFLSTTGSFGCINICIAYGNQVKVLLVREQGNRGGLRVFGYFYT